MEWNTVQALDNQDIDTSDLKRNPRVVGGHRSEVTNHPYMVNIRRKGNFECGGSLITPYCVLTAAHCLKQGDPSDFVVRGGVSYLNDMRNPRLVRRILLPSTYNRSSLDDDVALLQLQQPLLSPIAKPIRLALRSPRPGTILRVSGWGLTDERSKVLPNQLHTVQVRVMAHSQCRDLYYGYRNITASMYCASVPGYKDACAADSGGPAVNPSGQLAGIVSWGKANQCAREQSPGVYTDIVYMYDWIRDNMQIYC
ncbi:uncharacterized protein Dwil_GK25573 [Drosophila willistoni]|uniref:trypsin n=1 Tax=Drosophila willistoni TaxID=7260 RepID=B4N3Q2_DROWI|nr:trypsin beta [Drosophila willistoni]EDW79257.1 uncharacterized protein Dwil_GK25573 [Drosophila willistoni]